MVIAPYASGRTGQIILSRLHANLRCYCDWHLCFLRRPETGFD
ncbi:hypothetical protein SPAB_05366 [Salmonella enterica subsp. enterica serovar Paratyphi B str. SPB7]|uniref:Uncharacterized protein n=1 Tax=Salmonella paratyphi B (strain ATCC BAA-1250 / SPB7) TaxID=1016998 RepID=A0A6C6ZAD6_SALPB|nr:hypothetical protein SPAB_05366 [Salmonella enterica subsp. enterica serovar Paratyphi B str. SPB7]